MALMGGCARIGLGRTAHCVCHRSGLGQGSTHPCIDRFAVGAMLETILWLSAVAAPRLTPVPPSAVAPGRAGSGAPLRGGSRPSRPRPSCTRAGRARRAGSSLSRRSAGTRRLACAGRRRGASRSRPRATRGRRRTRRSRFAGAGRACARGRRSSAAASRRAGPARARIPDRERAPPRARAL